MKNGLAHETPNITAKKIGVTFIHAPLPAPSGIKGILMLCKDYFKYSFYVTLINKRKLASLVKEVHIAFN